MTDRSQLPAGVPHLLDQYKQRRQAWLDQADELARLRDEVRLAAEREALGIVTAARRDVRRIVVEARRELLVLTAQLHAAIESVDQASLQPGEHPDSDAPTFGTQADPTGSVESLGATRDAVLGARREVRSVLDEARAEIEALAAEARAPLPEAPAALPRSLPEPPIPTLQAILGSEPVTRAAAPTLGEAAPLVDFEAVTVPSERHVDLPAAAFPPPTPMPYALGLAEAPAIVAPAASAPAPRLLSLHNETMAAAGEAPVSFVLAPPDTETMLGGFHKRDAEQPTSLATFGETGPVHVAGTQTAFLDDYGDHPRSRPMWAWVGMFAATGVLLLAGAAWWAQAREQRNTLLASITATSPTALPGDGKAAGSNDNDTAASTTPAAAPPTPAGLAIEVRRDAWMRAIVDGKEDSRVYKAGETRTIVGARTVSLRAGDGGAVFVAVDGRPAEALGVSGVAVTRQFSPAGPAVVPAVATAPAPAPSPAASTAIASPASPAAASPAGSPAAVQAAAPRAVDAAAPAPAAPAPAPSPAPTPSAPAAGPEGTPGTAPPANGGRADLVSAGQQWLDAYQRRDRDGMAATGTENVTISDERTLTERFPAWQTGIRRDLDQVELELTGDTALLTARMTERSGDGSTASAQHVSRISQIWVRRSGRWRVADVRIMGEGRLNQIVR